MVDWPSNNVAPVPAFLAPADPAAAARALAKASEQLEDIFRTAPRKIMKNPRAGVGRLFPLAPLADCLVGFMLPQIPGIHEPSCFGVPMMIGGESTNEFVVPSGWFIRQECNRSVDEPFQSHASCTNGNQSFNLGQRVWSYALFGERHSAWFQNNGLNGLGTPENPAYWWQAARRYEHPDSTVTTFPHYETSITYSWATRARHKPAQKVTGAGRSRTIVSQTGLTIPRRPPATKRERHSKQSWGPGAFPFRFMLEGTLEGCDMAEQVNSALPVGLRDTSGTCAGQMGAIWEHWVAINWNVALMRIVDNEIEDRFYGAFGKMTKAEARAVGRPAGLRPKPLGTGPEQPFPRIEGAGVRKARNGGWTPCVFCV